MALARGFHPVLLFCLIVVIEFFGLFNGSRRRALVENELLALLIVDQVLQLTIEHKRAVRQPAQRRVWVAALFKPYIARARDTSQLDHLVLCAVRGDTTLRELRADLRLHPRRAGISP